MRKVEELRAELRVQGVSEIDIHNEIMEYMGDSYKETWKDGQEDDWEITDEDFETALADIKEARSAKC